MELTVEWEPEWDAEGQGSFCISFCMCHPVFFFRASLSVIRVLISFRPLHSVCCAPFRVPVCLMLCIPLCVLFCVPFCILFCVSFCVPFCVFFLHFVPFSNPRSVPCFVICPIPPSVLCSVHELFHQNFFVFKYAVNVFLVSVLS